MSKKVLIIIPAYNEEKNIEIVVDNIIENYSQYDYIVINDGSTDETAAVCKQRKYNLLDLPVNLGLSGAFQAGVRYAYKNGYNSFIQLDGDGQHNPMYIESMLKTMEEENVDIVIGSRFVDAKSRKMSPLKSLGSNIIRLCIKITTGANIYDPTSGMRLYSRKVMKEFAYNMNYFPEPDTISYLIRSGIRVKEIKVDMAERLSGSSYLNVKRAIQYMVNMCVSILFIQAFRKRE